MCETNKLMKTIIIAEHKVCTTCSIKQVMHSVGVLSCCSGQRRRPDKKVVIVYKCCWAKAFDFSWKPIRIHGSGKRKPLFKYFTMRLICIKMEPPYAVKQDGWRRILYVIISSSASSASLCNRTIAFRSSEIIISAQQQDKSKPSHII